MMHERKSTQGGQHRHSMSKQSAAAASSFSSSCSCFAATLRNCGMNVGTGGLVPEAAWSMSSVLTALPESPSPICSCSHPTSSNTLLPTHCLQDYATEFSSPRNQSSGIADDDNNNNCAICFSNIDEWLEHANKFCKPSSNSHTTHLTEMRGNAGPEEEDIERMSATCSNTFLTAPEIELYNITLPSIREESPVLQRQTRTRLSCIYGQAPSPSNERRTLLSGTKPYNAQLRSDESRRKKDEAERSKARHDQLVNRMRRKEKAIDNWEVKQTRRAMDEMDKIQNKLERKQLMASVRTQKKICTVRDKAEKQKLNLRQQTLKRFQQLQTSETKSPTHSSWSSRLPLC